MGTMNLDERQRAAAHAEHWIGQTVVAGPGAGKTAVIAERVAWMVREGHAKPGQIVCVTFTRAMAADLRRRIAERMGDVEIRCKTCNGSRRVLASIGILMDCSDCCGVGRTEVAGIECGTLHSLAAKWIRQALRGEIAGRAEALDCGYLDDDRAADFRVAMPWEVDAAIDDAAKALGKRVTKKRLRECLSVADRSQVETWEPGYEARRLLRARNLLRFDDLTRIGAQIVSAPESFGVDRERLRPISSLKPFAIVDEAQDLRGDAALMMHEWSGPVTRVGDDAQAIYGFTGDGATFDPHRNPDAHRLGANYRAAPAVATFGRRLRTALASMTDGDGRPLCVDLPSDTTRDGEDGEIGSASVVHVVGVPESQCGTDTGGICASVDGGEPEIVRIVMDHMLVAEKPGDVMVLAATRAELDEIQAALEESFVPCARLERKPLAGMPEARMPALLALARSHAAGAWSEDDALAVAADPEAVSRAVSHALGARIGLGTALDAMGAGVKSHVAAAGFPGWARWSEATPDPWPALVSTAGGDPSPLREWLAAETETRRAVGIHTSPMPAEMLTWLASDEAQRPTREPHAVCLATFHGSKGLESPRVVVVGACEGANPPRFARDAAAAADWHRAFYVACTRARDHLTVVRPEFVRGKPRGANELLARAGLDIEDSPV